MAAVTGGVSKNIKAEIAAIAEQNLVTAQNVARIEARISKEIGGMAEKRQQEAAKDLLYVKMLKTAILAQEAKAALDTANKIRADWLNFQQNFKPPTAPAPSRPERQ